MVKTIKKTSKPTVKKVVLKTTKPVVAKEVKKTMRKTIKGIAVSDKMQKTVVVSVERKVAHKLYGKLIKVTKKIKADTNGMEIAVGDVVIIEQTRPISKDKSFRVIRKEGGSV